MDPVNCHSGAEGLFYGQDALVGGVGEFVFHVGHGNGIADEAAEPVARHPEALLDGLLEGAAYGHDLAHGLHGRAQQIGDAFELAEVPAGDLADHVVQRRLEAGGRHLGHGVGDFVQTVAEAELGGHEGQRIARSLGRKGGGAAEARVHLDDPVVVRFRVQGVLHVAFAHDAHMAHDAYGGLPQHVVLVVAQRLRRGHDDALPGVYAEGVEVLHVADGDAVVVLVAHHFVLDFLPALQRLLHEDLRGVRECGGRQFAQLCVVGAEAGAQAAERVCRTDDHGVADLPDDLQSLFHRFHGHAVRRFHAYLLHLVGEEVAVLGLYYGLHRGSEHPHAVPAQHAAVVQLHAAVERRLAAEGEHYRIRTFLDYHLGDEVRRHRQEVGLVGDALGGLHRGHVGVDQDGLYSLFPQGLEGLGAGIVELSGLAYLERARAEKEYRFYAVISHFCIS